MIAQQRRRNQLQTTKDWRANKGICVTPVRGTKEHAKCEQVIKSNERVFVRDKAPRQPAINTNRTRAIDAGSNVDSIRILICWSCCKLRRRYCVCVAFCNCFPRFQTVPVSYDTGIFTFTAPRGSESRRGTLQDVVSPTCHCGSKSSTFNILYGNAYAVMLDGIVVKKA